jgi:hypothetical protein
MNLYEYVSGNPARYLDPTGLERWNERYTDYIFSEEILRWVNNTMPEDSRSDWSSEIGRQMGQTGSEGWLLEGTMSDPYTLIELYGQTGRPPDPLLDVGDPFIDQSSIRYVPPDFDPSQIDMMTPGSSLAAIGEFASGAAWSVAEGVADVGVNALAGVIEVLAGADDIPGPQGYLGLAGRLIGRTFGGVVAGLEVIGGATLAAGGTVVEVGSVGTLSPAAVPVIGLSVAGVAHGAWALTNLGQPLQFSSEPSGEIPQPEGTLTRLDEKYLEQYGIDPHEIKDGLGKGLDIYRDRNGNLFVKPWSNPDNEIEWIGHWNDFTK